MKYECVREGTLVSINLQNVRLILKFSEMNANWTLFYVGTKKRT